MDNKNAGFWNESNQSNLQSECIQNTLKIFLFIILVSITIVTIIGNLIVILCFAKYKQVRTVNNYYILNLSIADLIIGMLMPFYAVNVVFNNGYWKFGKPFCRIWLVIDYVVGTASVLQIVFISFDRFFSVVYPIKYHKWPMRKVVLMNIFLIWLLAFLNYGPAIILWPALSKKYGNYKKELNYSTHIMPYVTKFECRAEFRNNIHYLIIPAFVEFFIPFISITVFNVSIYLNIRQRMLKNKLVYDKITPNNTNQKSINTNTSINNKIKSI